jgi:hypothetical protein
MKVALNGNVEIARMLLDAGADAKRGSRLLAMAAHPRMCGCGRHLSGCNPSRKMVLLLLRAGAPLPVVTGFRHREIDWSVRDVLDDPAKFLDATEEGV